VASVSDCKPKACRRCGQALSGEDAEPLRHQVAELPPIEPEVHEYRLHRLPCPHCQTVTCGTLPDGVPRTAFGPRLHAALSVLTGAYRLSKRQVVQLGSDLLGLTISVGMISKLERITAEVLEQPVAELAEAVKTAEAANIDETGWRENGRKAWLWVVVTTSSHQLLDHGLGRPLIRVVELVPSSDVADEGSDFVPESLSARGVGQGR
ncbi:MAG TPA: transposase, partial [Isosphaeraceae bacterium]|nr:transposase [Isosphaeraceae bacterium]